MRETLKQLCCGRMAFWTLGLPLAFGALTFGLGPKLAYCAILGG